MYLHNYNTSNSVMTHKNKKLNLGTVKYSNLYPSPSFDKIIKGLFTEWEIRKVSLSGKTFMISASGIRSNSLPFQSTQK